MTRGIIEEDEGYPLLVCTFWDGQLGECVQFITCPNNIHGWQRGYTSMTRADAVKFLMLTLKRLLTQVNSDRQSPPWWQTATLEDWAVIQKTMIELTQEFKDSRFSSQPESKRNMSLKEVMEQLIFDVLTRDVGEVIRSDSYVDRFLRGEKT
jgi:hypothetical protein